jgi:hypothetical protein
MTKKRKNRNIIYQRIKQKLWEKRKRREKKLHKRKVQVHEPRTGLPVPRKFRRQSTSLNINSIQNKESSNNKRNLFIKKYLPTTAIQ